MMELYHCVSARSFRALWMLEELGLPYEFHRVDIMTNDQFTPEFLSINPNNKIPAILDPDGPGGQPMPLWETGAILIYLADKTGRLLPQDPVQRYQTIQWLMWQMGGVGPMFGQVGFFYRYGGKDFEDKRPLERYVNETRRLLGVLDQRLEGRDWVMGDYSVADIAIFPWVRCMRDVYQAAELVGIDEFRNVLRVLEAFLARPAVQKGLA